MEIFQQFLDHRFRAGSGNPLPSLLWNNVEFVNCPRLARQESVLFNPVQDKAYSQSVRDNPAE